MNVTDTLVANHRRFLSFLERRVGSRDLAEDILQAAFVKASEKGDSLRESESVTAWFYRLLRNAVVDHYRHRGAEQRALEAQAREVETGRDDDMERVVCACVTELAQTLKDEYATLLKRVDVDGAALQQAAAEAGITPNNAAVRLHRARQALRKQVEMTCRTCAQHGCLDCTCAP